MRSERYEDTELELVYKQVLTCNKCKRQYGQDALNPKNVLCPFCERNLFNPRSFKKKEEDNN